MIEGYLYFDNQNMEFVELEVHLTTLGTRHHIETLDSRIVVDYMSKNSKKLPIQTEQKVRELASDIKLYSLLDECDERGLEVVPVINGKPNFIKMVKLGDIVEVM